VREREGEREKRGMIATILPLLYSPTPVLPQSPTPPYREFLLLKLLSNV
jgi:hypothetical protein